MAETTLRAVLCPCCKQLLYALEPHPIAGWGFSKDSPTVTTDKNGPYIKCLRCSRRIAMVKNGVSGEAPYLVAAKQSCDQILR
jgi:DNA-directed RNA polymerase subunit RPC12/RpoP